MQAVGHSVVALRAAVAGRRRRERSVCGGTTFWRVVGWHRVRAALGTHTVSWRHAPDSVAGWWVGRGWLCAPLICWGGLAARPCQSRPHLHVLRPGRWCGNCGGAWAQVRKLRAGVHPKTGKALEQPVGLDGRSIGEITKASGTYPNLPAYREKLAAAEQ